MKISRALKLFLAVTLLVASLQIPLTSFGKVHAGAPSGTLSAHYNKSIIEVKFADAADVSLQGNTFVSGNGSDLSAVNSLLSDAKVSHRDRLFSDSAAAINSRRAAIKAQTGKDTPNLNNYYRIHLNNGTDAAAVSAQLKTLPGVADAYAGPLPASSPTTADFTSLQTYFTASPRGMGVTANGTFPGGKGGLVNVADVEYSWNVNHEDISKARAPGAMINMGTPLDPFSDNGHGTAVIGAMSADANTFGVTGIVPNAGLHMINVDSVEGGYDPANAIALAQANLTKGDVIVIEQQTWGPDNWYVPEEWIPSVYDAIVNATSAGIVVVEAGANGGIDLDGPLFAPNFPNGKPDDGAIIVGAGAACGVAPNRSRMYFSNFGSRINVQSYGECVVTTGGHGDLYDGGGDINRSYTSSFNGTSSATALIGGAAASVSSMYEAVNGVPATSQQVRTILVNSGVAQDLSVNPGNIGPLPNLMAAEKLIDTTAPTAPAGLKATLNKRNKVVLHWTAATDNVGVASYKIYRNGVLIKTTTNAYFTDSTVKAKTTYSYKVQAVDKVGNVSVFTPTVKITTR